MRIPVSLVLLCLLFAEIAGFIFVGEAIGVLPTLGLVLLGMIAGTALLRRQGMATLIRIRADLAANRTPARPLAEGAVLAGAAVLIIIPGFVTDLLGILLFVPPIRDALLRAIRNRVWTHSIRTSTTQGAIVDLDQNEYGAQPRSDTPWRRPEA